MSTGATGIGWLAVPVAIVAGAFRGRTPFLFFSLGECLTEKSGKINLGLEGVLLLGAMSGYAISYKTGSRWLYIAYGPRCCSEAPRRLVRRCRLSGLRAITICLTPLRSSSPLPS